MSSQDLADVSFIQLPVELLEAQYYVIAFLHISYECDICVQLVRLLFK